MDDGRLARKGAGKALDRCRRVINETLGGSKGADHPGLRRKSNDAILNAVKIDPELFGLFCVFVLIFVLVFRLLLGFVLGLGLLLGWVLGRRRHRSGNGLFFLGFLHFGFVAQRREEDRAFVEWIWHCSALWFLL